MPLTFQGVVHKTKARTVALFKGPYFRALCEVVFSLVVSNAFLLLSFFLYFAVTEAAEASLAGAYGVLKTAIRAPEVLVYILGIISPTIWFMFANVRAKKHVVWFYVIFTFQGVIILLSSVIYSLDKLGQAKNQDFIYFFAWVCFASAVVVWYGVLVFQRYLNNGLRTKVSDDDVDQKSNAPEYMSKLRAPQ